MTQLIFPFFICSISFSKDGLSKLVNIQRQIGGGIVYLDCEDKEELTSFYKCQNFKQFDDRYSTEDKQKYIQFMRFF